jgi:hypothetical protein
MSFSLPVTPGGSPLFREGGKPPSRRRGFLHKRFSGEVKQIMLVVAARRKGGNPPKRISASAGKRDCREAARRYAV